MSQGGAILNISVAQTLQECIAHAVQKTDHLMGPLTRAVHACVVQALHGQDIQSVREWVKVGVQDCIQFSREDPNRNLLYCLTKDAELTVNFGQRCIANMQESASAVTSQLPTTETLLEQLKAVTTNFTDSAMNQINEHPIAAGCLFGAVTYSIYQCLKVARKGTSSTNTPNKNHKKLKNA